METDKGQFCYLTENWNITHWFPLAYPDVNPEGSHWRLENDICKTLVLWSSPKVFGSECCHLPVSFELVGAVMGWNHQIHLWDLLWECELFPAVSLNPTTAMFETLFSQKKQIFRARLSFQLCPEMSREQSSVNCSSFKMRSMAL